MKPQDYTTRRAIYQEIGPEGERIPFRHGNRENVGLLDNFGQPDSPKNHEPIARIAACLYAEQPYLDENDCEDIVVWLKKIKFQKQDPKPWQPDKYLIRKFESDVEELRNSPEQLDFMKAVRSKQFLHDIAVAASVTSLLAALTLFLLFGIPKLIVLLGISISAFLYNRGSRFALASIETAKRQERVFTVRTLLSATSVDHLESAQLLGIFEDYRRRKKNSERLYQRESSAARERLSDALYRESYHSFTCGRPIMPDEKF
jgi:hypothetical protein